MTDHDADPFVHFDAAYALGALSDDDRDAFELHMAGCAECRSRVAEIADLPDLLAGLPASAYAAAEAATGAPPDTLLPSLLRQVRREQRRRRLVVTGLGGAVAACLVALAVLVWPSAPPARPAPREMTALAASPVHATAALVKRGWGTEIDLVCRYDTVYSPPAAYSLVVVDEHGTHHAAGSWTLRGSKQITFTGGTSVPLTDIASVQITLADHPILALTP